MSLDDLFCDIDDFCRYCYLWTRPVCQVTTKPASWYFAAQLRR